MEKPRVTEIHVRMDCDGCMQKIKKALNGIHGTYDLYIDFPQQKITIIGWTDPEKIVKAMKKTRKMATICNIEPNESPSQPAEPSTQSEPEGNAQAPEATQPQPPEVPQFQAGPLEEPLKDTTTPQEQKPQPHEATTPLENNPNQQSPSTPVTNDVGEVHMAYHNQPNCRNRFGSSHNYVGNLDRYHNSSKFLQEPPQPVCVTHSYRSSPYVTEYEFVRSPPPRHTDYSHMEHYSGDYQNCNGNITSMFSDENPNACRIV